METIEPVKEEVIINQVTEDFKAHRELMFHTIIQMKAKKVLELGTDVGDSMRIFSKALSFTGGHLWSVDIKPCTFQWPKPDNVTLITADALSFSIDEEVDLLFIDDDHTYPHVLHELERFAPWVRKDGMIFLHDTLHAQYGLEVTRSIIEFCYKNQLIWTSLPEQHGMGIIRMTKSLR